MRETIHVTSAGGRAIDLTISAHYTGHAVLSASIPSLNRVVDSRSLVTVEPIRSRTPDTPPAATHILCTEPPIAITHETAAVVEAAVARVRAAWRTTPDGLRATRHALAEDVRTAEDVEMERQARAWDDEQRVTGVADERAAIDEALAALRAFDAAHPEIAAEMAAERDQRVARALRGED